MIALLFYVKDSPGERQMRDLERQLDTFRVETKLVEADSLEGTTLVELHDITARPAVVLVRDDGSAVERWQTDLPLAEDISYLAHQ
jgi:hypothetical protein